MSDDNNPSTNHSGDAVPDAINSTPSQSEALKTASDCLIAENGGSSKTTLSAATPHVSDAVDGGGKVGENVSNPLKLLKLSNSPSAAKTSAPRSLSEAKSREYKFWATQPVPSLSDTISCESEPIEQDKTISDIRQTPYDIPDMFVWSDVNLNNNEHLQELYTLLNENYVEDEDELFRFDYSTNFLKWALQPPGWLPEWHVGIRVDKNKKLVGFISAIPATIQVVDKLVEMVEINFLCVHKKLRGKRVAPVLIKEITRRVNLTGRFQAVYTGGVVLPKPVATCRYFHRSINPKKLIECQFSSLQKNMTLARTVKLHKLPDKVSSPTFQVLRECHVAEAYALLTEYLSKFPLAPRFTEEEFRHWFLPRDGILQSFVITDPKSGAVTDFASFYSLPSSVINNPNHKNLYAAYSFYNVATSVSWTSLIRDVLITARDSKFDVFNALDLMDNSKFLSDLKFGQGDGSLHYYLYNWRCRDVKPNEVGLVLQ